MSYVEALAVTPRRHAVLPAERGCWPVAVTSTSERRRLSIERQWKGRETHKKKYRLEYLSSKPVCFHASSACGSAVHLQGRSVTMTCKAVDRVRRHASSPLLRSCLCRLSLFLARLSSTHTNTHEQTTRHMPHATHDTRHTKRDVARKGSVLATKAVEHTRQRQQSRLPAMLDRGDDGGRAAGVDSVDPDHQRAPAPSGSHGEDSLLPREAVQAQGKGSVLRRREAEGVGGAPRRTRPDVLA